MVFPDSLTPTLVLRIIRSKRQSIQKRHGIDSGGHWAVGVYVHVVCSVLSRCRAVALSALWVLRQRCSAVGAVECSDSAVAL